MTFLPPVKPGQVLNNQELAAAFRCSTQGGMRRSLKTGSLLLISNHIESIYDDRWIGELFHYTGMGSEGNQSLSFMQNKTLNESRQNGVAVFLCEVFKGQEYTYRGQVELVADPYPDRQPDKNGHDREVWVFPLKLMSGNEVLIPDVAIESVLAAKEREARRLSDTEIFERARRAKGAAGTRTVSTTQRDRNPWVTEYVKRRAKGICELCRNPAPFDTTDGLPYLECHHVNWLANGGEDSIRNTVALCPNCHRRMHIINSAADRAALQKVCVGESFTKRPVL